MKRAADSVFKLIKSMTIAEKRYVKRDMNKYNGKSENYNSTLFDILNSLAIYDEKKLLKKIKSPKLRKNFRVQKQYLYEAILNSLRAYEALANLEVQLVNQLENGKILLKKGLLEEALIEADRVLVKAREQEFYLIWMDALWLKHDLMQGIGKKKNYVEEARKIFEELVLVTTLKRQFVKGRSCNAEFFFLTATAVAHSIEDDPQLWKVKAQNEENKAINSVKIRQLYWTNQAQFCGLVKDYAGFMEASEAAYENIENSYLKKAEPVAYFIALSHYAYGLNLVKNYTKLAIVLHDWEKELMNNYWDDLTRARSITAIRRYSRNLKLMGCIPAALGETLKFDAREEELYESVYFEYNSLIEYEWIQGNYDKVFQAIIDQELYCPRALKTIDLKRNRLLEVVICFEQNNLIGLSSAVDKAKYFHKKKGFYTTAEMFFLNRFNRDYTSAKEQFLPVYEEWKNHNIHHPLVKIWLKSKVLGESMVTIYRAQNKAELFNQPT